MSYNLFAWVILDGQQKGNKVFDFHINESFKCISNFDLSFCFKSETLFSSIFFSWRIKLIQLIKVFFVITSLCVQFRLNCFFALTHQKSMPTLVTNLRLQKFKITWKQNYASQDDHLFFLKWLLLTLASNEILINRSEWG